MRISLANPLAGRLALGTDSLPTWSSTSANALCPAALTSSRRAPLRILLLLIAVLAFLALSPRPRFPPSYADQRQVESSLPWITHASYPEGKDGRYVLFDAPKETGFNHQFQRVLLQHHLAVLSNRSYAFEPVSQDGTSRLASTWRAASIPLSAFLSTVVSGFEQYYQTPRAVPASRFKTVCPSGKQQVLSFRTDANPAGEIELDANGQTVVHQLQVLLSNKDEPCVRVEGDIFNDEFFDSSAPLELYQTFSKSPVLAQFSFSPLILDIINLALPKLVPGARQYDLERAGRSTSSNARPAESRWRSLLALHLKRDPEWEQTCDKHGLASDHFVAFNKLPDLPGNENVPPPVEVSEDARMGLYRAKCNPTVVDVIARARRMKKNHPLLKSIYIATEADDEWIEEARKWLASDGWERVWIGKRDVWPDHDQSDVGVGVDMEIARRAGVFVGNGFSTTSSNIVLLRMRDGVHPDFTQFW